MTRFSSARLLFLCIVALEAAHTATGVVLHRVPSTHDGFQYFTLQYFFLNNAIQGHEVAQWIPYMTQGTIASLWYGIQGSFLQAVLQHLPAVARGGDLLSIYHLGMLVDEMILLTGTWLLARRFFAAPAAFFVSVSVVASGVWLDQPYWNFRLYYAIPLVIELGHRFLESGRWRWAFLAANLLALQTIGNLPYFIPLTSFVVFAYFAFHAATNRTLVSDQLRSLRWDRRGLAALAGGALSLAGAYKCVTLGTEQLVNYNVGRSQSGTTSLSYFMSYGGFTDIGKWNDLVFRMSPVMDNTLYAGMLLAPLLVIGTIVVDRRRVHLVLTAGMLLLFTLSTPVSRLVFYAWPGMWYFRHIGLVSALVKVLFCFVAGLGFEWLFRTAPTANRTAARTTAIVSAAALVLCAWWALNTASSAAAIDRYVSGISVDPVARALYTFDSGEIARRLRWGAGWAMAGAAIVALVPWFLASPRFTARGVRQAALCVVLAFAAIDVYQFKFAYLFDRTDGIGPEQRSLVEPSPMPYPHRRVVDLHQARIEGQSRLVETIQSDRLLRQFFESGTVHGTHYWTSNVFWFVDEVGSTFQADSWLAALDHLAQLFRTKDGVDFPVQRESAARLAGVRADKIRFFAHAYRIPALDDVKRLVSNRSYNGDLLFVSPLERETEETTTEAWDHQRSLSADDSRPLSYRVERFDANNLVVNASNSDPAPVWMFYSDVWHPWWSATVNGAETPVYRANVAYKAVRLEPGENVVHFRFQSQFLGALSALAAVNAGLWLIGIGAMMAGVLRSDR